MASSSGTYSEMAKCVLKVLNPVILECGVGIENCKSGNTCKCYRCLAIGRHKEEVRERRKKKHKGRPVGREYTDDDRVLQKIDMVDCKCHGFQSEECTCHTCLKIDIKKKESCETHYMVFCAENLEKAIDGTYCVGLYDIGHHPKLKKRQERADLVALVSPKNNSGISLLMIIIEVTTSLYDNWREEKKKSQLRSTQRFITDLCKQEGSNLSEQHISQVIAIKSGRLPETELNKKMNNKPMISLYPCTGMQEIYQKGNFEECLCEVDSKKQKRINFWSKVLRDTQLRFH